MRTTISRLYLPLFIMLFIFSCKKNNIDTIDSNDTTPDLITKVTSSVSGFVTNQNNAPVAGATVKAGTANTTTDKYGYFELKNVQVVKEAATVEVLYTGYFKGIKTYMATEGKAAFFRIKLLQKTIAGTINAASGGAVALSNGLNISLPVNAVKNAVTGSAYTGTVNVAAQFIDPTSNEVNNIMPGDLRGINADGNIKGLTSYGMMAVELTGASGELLQITDGKKSVLTFPVPVAINSSAPATIPLWYFDEANGLWKEQGIATKVGNTYVGEVSHFSFWNCDLPNAIVPLTFKLVDTSNKPLGFVHVEIVPITSNSWSHIGGDTDSSGYVSVFVTPNAQYALSVTLGSGCQVQNSLSFSVANTAVSLGNVVIGTEARIANVSGTVTDCNNNPVTNGYVLMMASDQYVRCNLDNSGAYHFSTFLCNNTTLVNFIAENHTSTQQSQTLPYTLSPGNFVINNIQACGVSTDVYLNFTINGRTFVCHNQTSSGANVQSYGDSVRSQFAWFGIETHNGIPDPNSLTNTQFIIWSYGSPQSPSSLHYIISVAPFVNNLLHFSTDIEPLSYITSNNYKEIPVNITEYGAVGQFIAGSYAGIFYEPVFGVPDLTRPYNVSCNFRVRRNN